MAMENGEHLNDEDHQPQREGADWSPTGGA